MGNYRRSLWPLLAVLFLLVGCGIGGGDEPSAELGLLTLRENRVEHGPDAETLVAVADQEVVQANDAIRVLDGGEALLDFGDGLQLTLFNDTELEVVSGEVAEDAPPSVLLLLARGGLTGELTAAGGKAVVETPDGAQITILGTEFFVTREDEATTVGNFGGDVSVTANGETVELAAGEYVEAATLNPEPLPFSRREFEERVRQTDDPLLLARQLRATTATALTYGQTIQGTFDNLDADDGFQFEGREGEVVDLRLWVRGDNGLRAERVYLEGPSGEEYEAQGRLPESGRFTGRVRFPDGYSGPYWARLDRLDAPAYARSLRFGEAVSRTLSAPLSRDAYRFTAQAGDTFLFAQHSAGVDLERVVYTPSGEQVDVWYRHELGSMRAKEAGTYTLFVQNRTGTLGEISGAYELLLERVYPPRDPLRLPPGAPVSGRLGTATAIDLYTFGAAAETPYRLRAIFSGAELIFDIYDRSGMPVLTNGREYRAFTLPEAGTYTAAVYSNPNSNTADGITGDYILNLWQQKDSPQAVPVKLGESVEDTLAPGAIDAYSFQARAGQRLRLEATWTDQRRGNNRIRVDVYDENGNEVINWVGSLNFTPEESGRYTVFIYENYEGTWPSARRYQFTLQRNVQ